MSDEDDDVAIAGEMEPEVTPDSPAAAPDDEGYDPDAEVEAAGEVETPVVRAGKHPRSKQVRELLRKAVEDLQKQREAEPDEDQLEYDEPEHPAPGTKKVAPAAGQASRSPQGATLATPQGPPAALPPAPSLDPEVVQLREQLSAHKAQLDQREQAIAERERGADVSGFSEKYIENRVGALRDWMKARGLAVSDEEWKDEVADLVTDLTGQVLGVPIPSEIKNGLDLRQVKRARKWDQQSRADREAELQRKQQETENQAMRGRAITSLGKELAKPEHAAAYPWLTVSDNPGEAIVDIVDDHYKKTGEVLKWQQAAQRANDYYEQQATAYAEKRRPLLERLLKPTNGKQQQRPPGRPPGPTQVIRTETQPQPEAPEPQPKPRPVNPRNWNDEHRRNTKRMMRAAFKPDQ